MVEVSLEDLFPGLRGQAYQITSSRDHNYNCVAWAAGDERNWWWPDTAQEDIWPAGVERAETVAAFRAAFATLGYVECPQDQLEGRPLRPCRDVCPSASDISRFSKKV